MLRECRVLQIPVLGMRVWGLKVDGWCLQLSVEGSCISWSLAHRPFGVSLLGFWSRMWVLGFGVWHFQLGV